MQETLLDRLTKEHPDEIDPKYPGGVRLCPEDLGYEQSSVCEYFQKGKKLDETSCLRCWDRPIPDESPKK